MEELAGLTRENPILSSTAVDDSIISVQRPQRLAGRMEAGDGKSGEFVAAPGLWVRKNEIVELLPKSELYEFENWKRVKKANTQGVVKWDWEKLPPGIGILAQGLNRIFSVGGVNIIKPPFAQKFARVIGPDGKELPIYGSIDYCIEKLEKLKALGILMKDCRLMDGGYGATTVVSWWGMDGIPRRSEFMAIKESGKDREGEKNLEEKIILGVIQKVLNVATRKIFGLGYFSHLYKDKIIYIKIGCWMQVSNTARDLEIALSIGEVKRLEVLTELEKAEEDMDLWPGGDPDPRKLKAITEEKAEILGESKEEVDFAQFDDDDGGLAREMKVESPQGDGEAFKEHDEMVTERSRDHLIADFEGMEELDLRMFIIGGSKSHGVKDKNLNDFCKKFYGDGLACLTKDELVAVATRLTDQEWDLF
jgi:hypothetical protein